MPFCARFEHDILPELNAKYVQPGKIVVAFREFPLPIHPFAQKAAEAAECASQQGKFWPMHDQLFQHQNELDQPNLQIYAKTAGLDTQNFETCLAGRTADVVNRDIKSGHDLAVSGTPTFFVGQMLPDGRVKVIKRLVGARPLSDFQGAIDPLLSAKNSNGL
jgi:protein-disulfide isomerase